MFFSSSPFEKATLDKGADAESIIEKSIQF